MMILLLVVLATLTALIYRRTANTEFSKQLNLACQRFQGPREFPIIGSGYVLLCPARDIIDVFERLRERFGPRFRLKIFHHNLFFLADPEDVKKVVTSTVHVHKGDLYFAVAAWLKDGLLTVKDANKYHRDRKLINPGFHFSILKNFLATINTHCKILINVLQRDFRDSRSRDIVPYIGKFTLDTICSTAMGTEANIDWDQESPYLVAIERILDLIAYRTFRPWLRHDIVWRNTKAGKEQEKLIETIRNYTLDVIEKRREARKLARLDLEGKTTRIESVQDDNVYLHTHRRLALLDTLLDAQDDPVNAMSDEDIAQHVDTFMFGGHDTTKCALSWALISIATSPTVQEKLHHELDDIFGSDSGREITPDDMARLTYLDQVIKETLRLYAPAPFIVRKLKEKLILPDGTIIPAGCEVSLPLILIQNDKKFFKNPQDFDPERFAPENSEKRHPYSYLPFVTGPRNCIGQRYAMMEMKAVLAYIFRAFTVESVRAREEVKRAYCILTAPENGIILRLFPRVGKPFL